MPPTEEGREDGLSVVLSAWNHTVIKEGSGDEFQVRLSVLQDGI